VLSLDLYEKTIKSKVIYSGRILTLNVDTVLTPKGATAQREIVKHPGAVAIVPVDSDNCIYLVRQFRKPVESELLEIPAGKIEKGETAEKCALRELVEEIGMSAGKLNYITGFFTSPGFSNEILHLFMAMNLKPVKYHSTDEDEFIEIKKFPIAETIKMIIDGHIKDSKTITGILLADKLLREGD
jgi:ADP-ribose pyrophosphatase